MRNRYNGVDFYAQKASARPNAPLTGCVLVVSRTEFNGICPKGIAVPKGQPSGIPVATWIYPETLARRCVKVTEAEARRIHPELFAKLEKYDRSASYRVSHAITVAEQFPARLPTQPADGIPGQGDIADLFHSLYS